jgi:hypothetical protein
MQITTIGLGLSKHWFQPSVASCDAVSCSPSFGHSRPAWSAWKRVLPLNTGPAS